VTFQESPASLTPIRILYLTDSPTVSGAEHVLFSYLDRLRAPAFTTHVFFRASNRRLREQLELRQIPHTPTRAFSERIIRTTLRPGDLLHFARAFTNVRRQILEVCRATGTDILHSISYPTALYGALAARATGCRHIWHEHNIKRLHTVNRPIYRFTARASDFVVGPSSAVTTALGRAGIRPPQLRVVYNGIDLVRFRPDAARIDRVRAEFGLVADQPAVGLVGQLLPYKGHTTLIDAAPSILAERPATRFFIVGALENPAYEAELRRRIQEAGLTDAVVFTGWRADVQDVIGAMQVAVVATLTPEPAALSLMETMALSRPVVASRTGGTPELVPDGVVGRLFAPGRADELAACVLDVLRDPDRARTMGDAGRRLMTERFSEERHVREMAGLYHQCLNRPIAEPA
jgi:glycosyltransferase involved in cell wall biosynthesis